MTLDGKFALVADLKTGACYRRNPNPSFSLFGGPATEQVTGSDLVPCSLLEGVPLAQLKEMGGGEDICETAAGLLVAPCTTQTGGLSFVDGTIKAIQDVCTSAPTKVFNVSSAGGKHAKVQCIEPLRDGARTSSFWTFKVIVPGLGFRDKEQLTLDGDQSGGKVIARVKKMLWQPHSSAARPRRLLPRALLRLSTSLKLLICLGLTTCTPSTPQG